MSWSTILDLATLEGDFYVLRIKKSNYGNLVKISDLTILPDECKYHLVQTQAY